MNETPYGKNSTTVWVIWIPILGEGDVMKYLELTVVFYLLLISKLYVIVTKESGCKTEIN